MPTPSQPSPLNMPTTPTGLAGQLRGVRRTVLQSVLSVLSKAGNSDEKKLEAVREEVLRALDACGPFAADIRMRVRHCTDLEDMWYLRPQLNGVLTGALGEEMAAAAMQRITALFVGAGFPVPGGGPPRRR